MCTVERKYEERKGNSRLPSRVGVGDAAMTTSGGKTSAIQSKKLKDIEKRMHTILSVEFDGSKDGDWMNTTGMKPENSIENIEKMVERLGVEVSRKERDRTAEVGNEVPAGECAIERPEQQQRQEKRTGNFEVVKQRRGPTIYCSIQDDEITEIGP